MLPWDVWGMMPRATGTISDDDGRFLDRLASTDVVEIRSDARCGVVVWAGVAIGPVG
jgi:hypothetical protein